MIKRYLTCLALSLLLMLLGACASILTSDLPLLKITPASLGAPRTLQQQLQVKYPNGQVVMESVLQIDAQKLTAINSSMGLRMATLDYDGKNLSAKVSPELKLPPERIINDLLIVYTPIKELQNALPKGWSINETATQRTLLKDKKPAIEVWYANTDHWQGRALLTNHQLYYSLTIDSSEVK